MISSLMGRERTLQARGIFAQAGMTSNQTSLWIGATPQARGESLETGERSPVGHTVQTSIPARGDQVKK